ncbi:A/G-specific adenine glycosylase [Lichenicoccus sp.]|uniref:A/G-specific adenine glycosylase n=1 Tax=Lichenicoccus sp. TaxID=2781899 RepID=UPI003D1160F2
MSDQTLGPDLLVPALLHWYARHRRVLPWRAPPGETADPYHVWLSEIMLQQTTVAAVIPYYRRFLSLFPTVEHLAAAPRDSVLQAWAGLGYYARARNLHDCACAVSALGGFPREPAALRALPGIGAYTAAAIAAIAFGVPTVPVDGNVERIATRLFAVTAPLPASRRAIADLAATLNRAPQARAQASDFAQALFDLGATLCTPRRPACALCPWSAACVARAQGIAETLPARTAKPARPQRFGAAFILTDASGQVLLRRRLPLGLLGGMTELPGTAWRAEPWTEAEALAQAPTPARWRRLGTVAHVFTHFALSLEVYAATVPAVSPCEHGFLRGPDAVKHEALPSLMRKCLKLHA